MWNLSGMSLLLFCWLTKWTTHCLLNENHYSGLFLFLLLLQYVFYLLDVFPLFSFQSMQHISGHAGLSHERESFFKAQQETWITNYNLFTFSFMRRKKTHLSFHEEMKLRNTQTDCKTMRLAHVKLDLIYTT